MIPKIPDKAMSETLNAEAAPFSPAPAVVVEVSVIVELEAVVRVVVVVKTVEVPVPPG